MTQGFSSAKKMPKCDIAATTLVRIIAVSERKRLEVPGNPCPFQ
jgi:hypothetical protein